MGLRRSRAIKRSFYEHDVYGMTPASHARFACISLGFAALFALGLGTTRMPVVPILALYTLIFILYAATFARGATGEDE
jgi:hypothetical protein